MGQNVFNGLIKGQCANIEEACKKYEMGFNAKKIDQSWQDNDGRWIRSRSDVVIRTDTMVELTTSSVGRDYCVVQYKDAFAPVDVLIANNQAELVSGGAPNRGEQAFLVLRSEGAIMLAPGDSIQNYFVMRSSHDGSCKIEIRMTPYRALSGTTFALDASKPLAFKHTPNVEGRLAMARRTWRNVQESWDGFSNGAKRMIATPVTDSEARDFIEAVLSAKKDSTRAQHIADDVYQLFRNTGLGTRVPACRGTLFGLVQSFCEWGDLHRTIRSAKNKNEVAAALDAKLIADTAKKKQKAWGMALHLSKNTSIPTASAFA
jgi:phage/plasmid-like protein (TIGR03299 family)